MSMSKIIEQVRPSIVYIICVLEGKIKLPKPGRTGNPTTRFLTTSAKIGGAGTGFIVDSDGYIVTNGHVLFSFTHSNISDDYYVKQLLCEKVAEERNIPIEYVSEHGVIDSVRRKIYVQFGESDSGFSIPRSAIPSRVVGVPSPASEKDIGVIKIDKTGLHPLDLGDSTKNKVGDRIYVIGYPGIVKTHPYLDEETGLEPTVTSGILSARRKTKDGSACIQTDAAIKHGNSGGHAINEDGEVIGVATFGCIGKKGLIQGFNFLRPSNLVDEFLSETGIKNIGINKKINILLEKNDKMDKLAVMLKDHGDYKVSQCKNNTDGYCQLWRWTKPLTWEKSKKDGKIYRIKTSNIYCGLCPSFQKKGVITPQSIDGLVQILEVNGTWKKDRCEHNQDSFCIKWRWKQDPELDNLRGKNIETKKKGN